MNELRSLWWIAVFTAACSSSSSNEGGHAENDAGTGGSAGSGGQTMSVDPFNGDCTTAKWASVSDECWQCLCGECQTTLNACDEDCIGIMTCSNDQGCLVNDAAQLTCEIQCVSQTCVPDAGAAASTAVTNFDVCLIGSPNKTMGMFRACEDICHINYTGDTCTRFPQ